MSFKKVRCASRSDDNATKLTLYRDPGGRICGWYIGPVRLAGDKVRIAYLPKSEGMIASVAIIRAIAAADSASPLCIIDPDDLWDQAWRG